MRRMRLHLRLSRFEQGARAGAVLKWEVTTPCRFPPLLSSQEASHPRAPRNGVPS